MPRWRSCKATQFTYRIAMGPHEGRKVCTLQTVPASERTTRPFLASHAGFSLHAGVAVRGSDRKTLERLCRYIPRPALAEGRLSLTPQVRGLAGALTSPARRGLPFNRYFESPILATGSSSLIVKRLYPKAWCAYHAFIQQMRDAMSEPIVLTPDQRPRALNVAGFDITVLASDAQTSGYEVFLQAGADGKGSSPHQHPWDESFYVISGEITCAIDGVETVASAGTFVHIPGGSTHWYKFGAGGAEMVSMTSKGNASRMYTDFDRESSRENPDRSHFGELAAKHGQQMATPQS